MTLWKENPWEVQVTAFPGDGTANEKLKFLLNYAVLAPSARNLQPWLFHVSGNELMLFVNPDASDEVSEREHVISCGAALQHAMVAMRHFGYLPVVRTFPRVGESDCLATLRLGERAKPSLIETLYFAAIKQRSTYRGSFSTEAIPPALLRHLVDIGRHAGAEPRVLAAIDERQHVATLAAEAAKQTSKAAAKPANANVKGGGKSPSGTKKDGTASATGPASETEVGALLDGTPAFLSLTTDVDTPVSWLAAGQALDRVLLLATASGLAVSYLNAPLRIETMRHELAERFGGQHPQFILRLGFVANTERTERRPVREAMKNGSLAGANVS